MMKAAVVIGANYGDEGKGLITDFLAAEGCSNDPINTLVIRFNGGAQAGHTVQRPNGVRHVFSHFSSGTFAGAQTYLSDFFIANPILFNQELEKLQVNGYFPKVTIHPEAVVTTPYDMFINQVVENFLRNKRHGSCGVGINETIERSLYEKYKITVKDLFDCNMLRRKLLLIRDEWLEMRLNQLIARKLTQDEENLILSEEIFEHFLNDVQMFLSYCDVADYGYITKSETLIFEGAQGLLLDQSHKNFPHVTRSNTGLQNVSVIATHNNIKHLDVYYVTRCYVTRHGAGPLNNEYSACPCPHFKDETNLPHKFQGKLRFAPLNIDAMNAEINADLTKLSSNISRKVTLAVTCLDQFEKSIPIDGGAGHTVELGKSEFQKCIFDKAEFDDYIFSYGPTREDCVLESAKISV